MTPCLTRTPRAMRSFLSFVLVLGLFVLSGCPRHSDDDGKYRSDIEEMMPVPYTPRDDGRALSAAELHAFKTVGELDRGLSAQEARIVELHFKNYIHKSHDSFQRFIDRSARFLPYIKQVFRSKGIPEEIAYLCMVESGGNPNARSHAGAVGLWQFMPATGRSFNLRQTSWMDERRDPFKATHAASDYLLKLYNDFSNWHLAIAAYNAGEGKIGRAVSGTGARDFFELCRLDNQLSSRARLKNETREYVPRLLAMTKIMRNLKRLGFQDPSTRVAWNLKPIVIPPGTNLAGLARNLDLTWDEFSGMNPAYRRTASPPNTSSTAYLPPNKMSGAQRWLAASEARIYSGLREYVVKRRDTLESVARRHGVTAEALASANGFESLPDKGSIILIPPRDRAVEQVYEARSTAATQPTASAGTYRVQQGDTLFSLANHWGTDVQSIRLANRMSKKEETLSPGQRISIPGNAKRTTPPPRPKPEPKQKAEVKQKAEPKAKPQASVSYTVKSGDTLASISRATGVSMNAIADANKLNRKNPKLQRGQKLSIPGGKPQEQDKGKDRGKSARYTVKKGDTAFSIARAAGISVNDLCEANKLNKKKPRIAPGQALVIPGGKAPADDSRSKANERKEDAKKRKKDDDKKDSKKDAKKDTKKDDKKDNKKDDKKKSGKAKSVTVKSGDTLYGIARANNISVSALQQANGMSSSSKLKPGQKLVIPAD